MPRGLKKRPEPVTVTGKSGKPDLTVPGAKVRIDKWLWAARFFKTRSLATEQVDGGKIKCNGERVKPAYNVQVGDELVVPHGWDEITLYIVVLADRRASATVAQGLYKETDESLLKRKERAANRALIKDPSREIKVRPTKRDRRVLEDLRWKD